MAHGSPGRPRRREAARAARASASTASPVADPVGAMGAASGSRHTHRRAARAASAAALRRKARSQLRTVEGGRARVAAMRRWPAPAAWATRAAPTTWASSRRRGSSRAGTSTWVREQAAHQARRGPPPPRRGPRRGAHRARAGEPPGPEGAVAVRARDTTGGQLAVEVLHLVAHHDHDGSSASPPSLVGLDGRKEGPTRVAAWPSRRPRRQRPPPSGSRPERRVRRRQMTWSWRRPRAVASPAPPPGCSAPAAVLEHGVAERPRHPQRACRSTRPSPGRELGHRGTQPSSAQPNEIFQPIAASVTARGGGS